MGGFSFTGGQPQNIPKAAIIDELEKQYDVEEVDRENATDMKRAADLGLGYRTSPGATQGARATPPARPDAETGSDGSAASEQSEQE